MRHIEEKNKILRNRKFLRGTQEYIVKALIIAQYEERRKEWKK